MVALYRKLKHVGQILIRMLIRNLQWKRICLPIQKIQETAGSICGSGRFPGGGNGNPL